MDITLADFAYLIENGDFPAHPIWASIPGGIIFGELVSYQTYMDLAIKEINTWESPGDAANVMSRADTLAQNLDERNYQEQGRPEDKEIRLVQVKICAGGIVFHRAFANVRLSSIGAWGMDEPIEITVSQLGDNQHG